MMKILSNQRFWQLTALVGLNLVFFGLTNAATVASWLLMVGFLLATLNLYALFYLLAMIVRLYGVRLERRKAALHATLLVGSVIALQSAGQLTHRDMLVILPLVAMAYFYRSYAKTPRL